MAYQTARQVQIFYKEEALFGVLPGASGATIFRPNSGTLNLDKTPIQSGENRRDGMMTRGRHGQRSVAGTYTGDLSVGTFDALIEAAFRGTWSSILAITQADVTSITTGANTIIATSGSWITLGLRVGDVIRLTGHSSTGNNSRNLRITAISGSTITVAETLTVNAVADTSITITRPKTLIQGLTDRSFTFEEREDDIDGTEIFKGVRIGSMRLQLQPNSMATVSFSCVGQDMEVLEDSNSPYFIAPTATSTLGLTAVEAVLRLGTEDVIDLTALDLNLDLNAAGVPVVGSNITPDVFTNLANVSMNITSLRQDMTRVRNFLNEDQLSLHIMFAENEAEPSDFMAFSVQNFTLATSAKSELGQDGPRTQTLTALVGVDDRGEASGYSPTMVQAQSTG